MSIIQQSLGNISRNQTAYNFLAARVRQIRESIFTQVSNGANPSSQLANELPRLEAELKTAEMGIKQGLDDRDMGFRIMDTSRTFASAVA